MKLNSKKEAALIGLSKEVREVPSVSISSFVVSWLSKKVKSASGFHA
jgi:hypothetical protein